MLTRDFTRSRNLSQELAPSRSRPACVAVVIGRKRESCAISTDVQKLWKASLLASFCRLRDSCPRRNVLFCPCRSALGPSGFAAPRTAAMRQRGIVADWHAWSKRKVCEGIHHRSHTIHSFSTSAKSVQFAVAPPICGANVNKNCCEEQFFHRIGEILPEENLTFMEFFSPA